MKQTLEHPTAVCGSCRKELPVEDFYYDKKNRKPDHYCKNCRNAASRARYFHTCEASRTRHRYPVITETADREERMLLILRAWRRVNESMMRKCKKQFAKASPVHRPSPSRHSQLVMSDER